MATCPLYTQVFLGALAGSGSHSKGAYTIETITAGLQVIWMNCFESTACQWWDNENSECSVPNNNLFNYHLHDSHEHAAVHGVADVPGDKGGATSPPSEPAAASVLSQEYMTGEDADGNSKIIGIDFGLDITDPEIPKMLLTILNDPNFPVGLPVYYTWAEYLATLP